VRRGQREESPETAILAGKGKGSGTRLPRPEMPSFSEPETARGHREIEFYGKSKRGRARAQRHGRLGTPRRKKMGSEVTDPRKGQSTRNKIMARWQAIRGNLSHQKGAAIRREDRKKKSLTSRKEKLKKTRGGEGSGGKPSEKKKLKKALLSGKLGMRAGGGDNAGGALMRKRRLRAGEGGKSGPRGSRKLGERDSRPTKSGAADLS